ncbi:hypothetical protein GCM10022286_05440 [Gryllotalpicola daejeonensis]|uniref:Uncharacterized protein n=1 Tax=Gryllotalpicola daejeonensis TaxID=993087 RepID=A0ABP7ZFB5_9MICO
MRAETQIRLCQRLCAEIRGEPDLIAVRQRGAQHRVLQLVDGEVDGRKTPRELRSDRALAASRKTCEGDQHVGHGSKM